MSGLFGAPFHLLQSPNLPVRSSSSKGLKKQPAKNESISSDRKSDGSSARISLPLSDSGHVPQPQPQDLDGKTLAPSAFVAFKDAAAPNAIASLTSPLNPTSDTISISSAATPITPFTPLTPVAHPASVLAAPSDVSCSLSARESQQERGGVSASPAPSDTAADQSENHNYSPVMDQLDETMVLLKSMQVAARAASDTPTPQPLTLTTPNTNSSAALLSQDKCPPLTPGVSFRAHAAQKEAWLAGYSSGLAHAHAQALCHIEELGNVQALLAAVKDAGQEQRAKHDDLASQLAFLQGTCTQAFTGIWQALGRNTSMIEERLQVEATFQSRLDCVDARVVANSLGLHQQVQALAALRLAKESWWQHGRWRVPQLPSHLLLPCLLAAAAAEYLLRYSSVVFGRRFRLGRKLLRSINALVAVLSFFRLIFRASTIALPVLQNTLAVFRAVTQPFAALGAAVERGVSFCCGSNLKFRFAPLTHGMQFMMPSLNSEVTDVTTYVHP
jgi:hypothetical protein